MKHMIEHSGVRIMVTGILLLLNVAGCQREPQSTDAQFSTVDNGVIAETTLLATVPDGHEPTGSDSALGNKPVFRVVFHEQGRGVAYIARINEMYHVVYNGKLGRPTTGIDRISISPDGQRMAYSAQADGKWGMLIDGEKGVVSESVGDPVFSPDSKHIAYRVSKDKKQYIALDREMHEIARLSDVEPVFSADSERIAYVEQAGDESALRLVVSDLAFRKQEIKDSIGPIIDVNAEHTLLAAVSIDGGKQRVIDFSFAEPNKVTKGPLYDSISDMVYGADGVSVAYIGKREDKRYLVLNGNEEPLPDGQPEGLPVIRPGGNGVGIIISGADGVYLHEAFSTGRAKGKLYEDARWLAYSPDGRTHAYSARKGDQWFIVVNGKEGPSFDIVVTPGFSPDGSRLVYRVRKNGMRFVVVADAEGKVLREHPGYEMVFMPVFTADGKSVAYGVKDGQKLIWKVESLD